VVVLLLWIPLRQRPGIGTLCNVVLVGAVIDAALAVVSPPRSLPVQAAVMVAGVILNGVATGLYIGAGLHRGRGAAGRLAARRHGRRRHRRLRGLHRAARPRLRAAVQPAEAWPSCSNRDFGKSVVDEHLTGEATRSRRLSQVTQAPTGTWRPGWVKDTEPRLGGH
jgi:hypothetical protein